MRKVNEYKIKKAWRGFSDMDKVIASSIENVLIGLKCLLVGNAPSNPISRLAFSGDLRTKRGLLDEPSLMLKLKGR